MLTDAVCAGVIDDASPEPLIGPGAQDVVPTVFQEGLEPQEQAAGQEVAEPPVAILPLHLPTDELLGTAQVELSVYAQVIHQGFDPVSFRVRVILGKVKPVVFADVML